MGTSTKLLSLILVVSFHCSLVEAKSKYVSLSLEAKWASSPLILEASEFHAKENNDLFWNYANSIAEVDPQTYNRDNDEEMYRFSLKIASKLLTPLQMNLLKFSLSLRTHSPTVEMFNHLALDRSPPKDCRAFVDINNMITCEKEAVTGFLGLATQQPKPVVIKSDHHYPGSKDRPVVAILYAELGTTHFNEWHRILQGFANEGKVNYILRHFVQIPAENKVRLSGYGVELAIKSTEYKAKDDTKVEEEGSEEGSEEDEVEGFIFSKLKELHPSLSDNLGEFRQHLLDSQVDLAPLKVWQLQDLSFQAAQKIKSAPLAEQLKTLRDVSQNFPTQARGLAHLSVERGLKKEVEKNQKVLENTVGISPGESALFINGIQADLDIYDVFTLLDTLKSEAKLMEGLHALGKQFDLDTEQMSRMLQIDMRDTDTNYAVDCRDDSVLWINNLEKDRKYHTWPSSVQELLRPSFPGMLRHVRRNLFNIVFLINPVDKNYKDLVKMAEAFYVHNAPVRIGLVFVVNCDPDVDGLADAGVAMLRAFNYIKQQENAIKALSFITDMYDRVEDDELTLEFVIQEFVNDFDADIGAVFGPGSEYDERRLVYDKVKSDEISSEDVLELFKSKYPKEDYKSVFVHMSQFDTRKESAEFFEKTGLGEVPQVLVNGVPMKKEDLGPDDFEEAVVGAILKQTAEVQKHVYHGNIYDGQDILEFLMTRSNVMPRLNSRVLAAGNKFLELTTEMSGSVLESPQSFINLPPTDMTAAIANSLHYLTKKGHSWESEEDYEDTQIIAPMYWEKVGHYQTPRLDILSNHCSFDYDRLWKYGEDGTLRPITNWLVADLDTAEGREFVYEAVKNLKHSNTVRYGIINNPSNLSENLTPRIAVLSQVALEHLSSTIARSFVTKLFKEENVEAIRSGSKQLAELAVHNMDFEAYEKALESRKLDFLQSHRIFCERVLNFKPGQIGIVSNGKVIGPLKEGEKFIQQDFTLLEKFMYKNSAEKIEQKLKNLKLEPARATDLLLRISTLLLSTPQKEPRKDIQLPEDSYSVIKLPAAKDGPAYDVVAVLDPSTRAAQKYTPIIMVLQEVANVNIKVFLNCRAKLSEMPLKSFYRYVLEPEVKFAVDSKLAAGPIAKFDEMPEKPLLTLGMDPPESWLVETVWAPYDLDNIHLAEVESGVNAEFELEYLLLEGHCYDSGSGQPPRGLQFILGTENWPDKVDTIVMANLGYFQLKASPGAWYLKMRPGRSQDIYTIVSHEFTDSPEDSSDVIVVIDSFKSKIIKVRVNKKAGKEREDLLSEKEEPQGLWDSISSKLSGGTNGEVEESDQTLNIFSVASGHLYERFLRIMMLSVMKHTQSKVKFWFLKNYLSPTFIKFIPTMAEKYGFDYELVQYKWPRWLHQQTEKQRIIWGYKILFLDVLFPLNVNKFIFVDADQIVRTDLQELHDFDLEGAPYGYTPFCDSRKEMDGFRFWKSGYWASHLAGRKYHISALYVVDLKKFRKIAAGDRLRGQYQGLSQDPNSLSNLDQDLPNNMIHQVNIKSLPQEWLYCETWCNVEEKAKAKTIDLCNNPLTKEPKLLAAVRIVPEWTDYDNEIKKLWDEFNKNKNNIVAPKSADNSIRDIKKDEHIEL